MRDYKIFSFEAMANQPNNLKLVIYGIIRYYRTSNSAAQK